ncbi:spore coat protein CotG [Bacillus swezeyi]|uniref:Uncharacterized protein n=1 Tax=Bacillus swezeyi TaxID=1925020 RepID=A0A5M8RXL4_9BACI|nr:hypothetical protein [Bacillus swezeyi]KAA6453385.1 hypothetical protein DX927_04085 [Bacillus swezeyi]KAA6476016.1 hypothetical protein DX928_07940 [Bacillus swezeyi]TYS38757.1 hypothetical protein FZC77_03965 [Bacillus swezeyi]
MNDVHDHDIKKAVDQLRSEGRDHYLDREPESASSSNSRRSHNIWDMWWGIKPDRSKKHDKSKKPDDCEKPDKSKKPDDCKKPDKSKKPDDCKKPDKSKKPDDCKKPDKSKKPDDCKKPDRSKKSDKCCRKRHEHRHCKKTHHHRRSKSGYETITKWSDGNLEEIRHRKR